MSLKEQTTWRYERKYVVLGYRPAEIEVLLRQLPFAWRRHHAPRWLHNIYFDSINWHCYRANLAGSSQRYKYRLRFYGPWQNAWQPARLELKQKTGELGRKHIWQLPNLDVNSPKMQLAALLEHSLQKGYTWAPKVYNCYYRQYYSALGGRLRLTLDSQQAAAAIWPSSYWQPKGRQPLKGLILELKYGPEEATLAEELAQQIPFRLSKNSKYIQAVQQCYRF
ncbi:VTC domain-containing protein [Saprospira grandis DSM 2844]|uniref:VTC domain-containing protein n=1 Tax=Saprospira grandis DSM 2844 TaxID=694433 RepID=J0XTV1_9BACT|nr:VTC domain-containing protein [Saprospira grandis]EJF52381.1 VTC domain-containing protein [Saprospira grandis DSM 2844]